MLKKASLLSICLICILVSVSFAQTYLNNNVKPLTKPVSKALSVKNTKLDDAPAKRGLTNDLELLSIEPQYAFVGKAYSPIVSVVNNGTATQSAYEVTLSDGIAYNETISGTLELAQSETTNLNFPQWIPESTEQSLLATVILLDDEFADNDTMTFNQVVELTYDKGYSYGFDAYGPNTNFFVRTNIETGETEPLMEKDNTDFITCGDYFDSVIMAIDYGNYVYYVNGDGMHYQIGHLDILSVTGLARDVVSDVTYLSAAEGTSSYLYVLDDNLTTTYIGMISSTLIIGIACDANGDLYGIDMGTDNFVSINKSTAEYTEIGNLGIDLNYAQDIGFDRVTNQLYGGLYSSFGGWYTIDTETGLASLISEVNRELTMVAIVPGDWISVGFTVDDGVNLIEGASILIDETELLTDVDGFAQILLTSGEYPYSVAFEGYETFEGTVLVEDTPLDIDVSLNLVNSIEQTASTMNIYPSPVQSVLYVNSDIPFEFAIYDLTGKLLVKDANVQLKKEIKLDALSPGIYLLKTISADGTQQVKKFIKE
jgi:hypothetical protein